jgi:hypothetical protein
VKWINSFFVDRRDGMIFVKRLFSLSFDMGILFDREYLYILYRETLLKKMNLIHNFYL